MKKIIKKLINSLGYDISRKPDEREIKILSFDEIYKLQMKKNPVIFDIGANRGQSIERFLKTFDYPTIHAFEPNKEEFDKLKTRFSLKKNIILNNLAIGDKKENKEFYLTSHSGNSSFIDLNPNTKWINIRSKQARVNRENYIKRREKVNINTIDNYLILNNINHIDLIKIDTQLYEDKVLKGCESTIKNQKVDAIEMEIVFSDAYKKYFSFSDLEKYLIPYNFRFSAIRLNNNNLFSGSIFFADILYLNKNKFNI